MRLLIVEDEAALAQAMCDHLRSAGYVVDLAARAEDAEAALSGTDYALVLLDLALPDGDGLNVLRNLRSRRSNVPVLIATARDRITERIAGLDAGADDYLVKPFHLDEMVARIAAILRRTDNDRQAERRIGSLCIQLATKTVLADGQPKTLTPKEWAILDRLSRRPEITVPKAELEDALYGYGEEVESNTIEAHVSRLRSKLGRGAIETVRGFGYRMGKG